MKAVDERLVRRDHALIQLLDPPFDRSDLDPGYIRGYVPGVRENGGQYTHGAIWAAMAFAALGDRERAWELMTMMNPVNHARTPEGVATYKVEPYVIAADVYAVAPHTGRGGWSWYTGSAGWMYRLIVESLLGVTLESDCLRFTPCLPADWTAFTMRYRYRETVYDIAIRQTLAGAGEGRHSDQRNGGWRRAGRRLRCTSSTIAPRTRFWSRCMRPGSNGPGARRFAVRIVVGHIAAVDVAGRGDGAGAPHRTHPCNRAHGSSAVQNPVTNQVPHRASGARAAPR